MNIHQYRSIYTTKNLWYLALVGIGMALREHHPQVTIQVEAAFPVYVVSSCWLRRGIRFTSLQRPGTFLR